MKSKALIFASTILMALALMAQSATQSATQSAPAPDDNAAAKSCACCNHDKADGKMSCCGKDSKCCGKDGTCCQGKDGKTCAMMSKDANGKMSCCGEGKCPMMSKKDGKAAKSCCGGKMCARPQAGV